MDHRKCVACHHEWDGKQPTCDWCQADSEVIGSTSWAGVLDITRKVVAKQGLRLLDVSNATKH